MNEAAIPHMTAFQIKAVENANVNKPNGRGERIRTSDSCVPNAVLYQAELHPEKPTLILAMPGTIHVRARGLQLYAGRGFGAIQISAVSHCPPALKQANWIQIKPLIISRYRKGAQIQQTLLVV